MENKKLIMELSNIFGPSGFEDDVADFVVANTGCLTNFHVDTLRNVTGELISADNDSKISVMIDAHMDEVGFIVNDITNEGMIKFLPLGGWAASSLPSSLVNIKTINNEIVEGIIAQKPVHYMSKDERSNTLDISNMYIDIGASSKEEVINKYNVHIADPVVPAVTSKYNENNGLFMGKAFDDRIGVAACIRVIDELSKQKNLGVNIAASFSTQEEVGCRGIRENVKRLQPTVAILLEGAPADDTFPTPGSKQVVMNKGPMFRFFDPTMIANPRFMRFALNVLDKQNIKYQAGVRSSGGTNGSYTHLNNIPTIVVGVPVRYIHSHHGYCSIEDFNSSVDAVVAIINALNKENITKF